MTCSARRSPYANGWRAWLLAALVLAAVGCAKKPPAPYVVDARAASRAATLVPADLAIAFLQEIKSEPNRSLLAGEATIPPCRFTEKGAWSGGEYRKVTGQRAPTQITGYAQWVLFRIEALDGRDFLPADLERSGAWNYSLRTPRTARTVFGTSDHCIIGPTTEPARKMVEALSALGVAIAPEFGYLVR